jgi:hypothetical protein
MWHVKDMDKVNPDWNAEIGRIKAIFAKAELAGMFLFRTRIKLQTKPH